MYDIAIMVQPTWRRIPRQIEFNVMLNRFMACNLLALSKAKHLHKGQYKFTYFNVYIYTLALQLAAAIYHFHQSLEKNEKWFTFSPKPQFIQAARSKSKFF